MYDVNGVDHEDPRAAYASSYKTIMALQNQKKIKELEEKIKELEKRKLFREDI